MRRKISPKFHVKNGVKNGKFHANFTLPGRNADPKQKGILEADFWERDVTKRFSVKRGEAFNECGVW